MAFVEGLTAPSFQKKNILSLVKLYLDDCRCSRIGPLSEDDTLSDGTCSVLTNVDIYAEKEGSRSITVSKCED